MENRYTQFKTENEELKLKVSNLKRGANQAFAGASAVPEDEEGV